MKFWRKTICFCVLTTQLTWLGVVSFGPVLGALMAVLFWSMFFTSLPMLGILMFICGLIGAFLNGFLGTYPDGNIYKMMDIIDDL